MVHRKHVAHLVFDVLDEDPRGHVNIRARLGSTATTRHRKWPTLVISYRPISYEPILGSLTAAHTAAAKSC